MNALDFFHCNACFSQPGTPKSSKFFLTNCGHSFCNECVNNTNVPQCRVCKASCKVIPLTNDLPDDLKLYFGDMVKEIKNVIKILVIQNKHCKIYMEEYAKKLEASYAENHRELSKVKTELTELKKHYQALSVENQALKKSSLQMSQVRNKSPFGLSSFNNSSNMSYNQNRGSAFLTPSPSTASCFSMSDQLSQDKRFFTTPNSFTNKTTPSTHKMANSKASGHRLNESLTTPRANIPPLNSQPFVLSSQPLQSTFSSRSRGETTPKSWSSGSGSSSRTTTKTLRKSRDSFMSKLNNSSIF